MREIPVFLKVAVAVFAVSVTGAAQMPDTRWFDNAETQADTFRISDAKELAGLAQLVHDGNDFSGKVVVLLKDIDLKEWGGWKQIGTVILNVQSESDSRLIDVARPFSGIFDGNGKTVKGLSAHNDESNFCYQGLFGYVLNGVVKNVGVVDLDIDGYLYTGGVVGLLDGGTVENCYSSGYLWGSGGVVGEVYGGSVINCYSSVRVSNSGPAGGVVGELHNGRVINSYSTGNIGDDLIDYPYHNGNQYNILTPLAIGGVVGKVLGVSVVTNCYSISDVRGSTLVGGVVGHLVSGSVINCVALNPIVNAKLERGGRVVGFGGSYFEDEIREYTITNNYAFSNMRNTAGTFPAVKGPSTVNGADLTIEEILSDSILDRMFTEEDGWTTEKGKLPGLLGKPVDIPNYLFESDAIAFHDREIPVAADVGASGEAVVAVPLNKLTAKFSVGPNPASKSSGAVNFYVQGKRIKSGALAVYDAFGNLVWKVSVGSETSAVGNLNKRLIAAWSMKDKRGRPVSNGTYLIRGTVTTADREAERVSAVVGVR